MADPKVSTPARRNPDGYVAQRFPRDFNGHGHWLLTYLDEGGNLAVQVFTDDDVADWSRLSDVVPGEGDPDDHRP